MSLEKKGMHWYLTDEEVMFVKNQLADLRKHMNYVPGKWCLSGLNTKPEVMSFKMPDKMPKKVLLRDISLRTATQMNNVEITREERVRMLKALTEIGVSSFQLSMGLSARGHSADDMREEIAICKSFNPDAEIEITGVHTTEGLDLLKEMGANCAGIQGPANYAISPFYGGGEIEKLTWEGKDWRNLTHPPKNLSELVERNKPLIDYANKKGIKIKASLNMLHWADEETIERFAREMGNAGAYYISLQDGPGAMSPNAIAYAVSIAKKAAPDTKIAVHLHNTFGLGIARALNAIQAGAEMVECRVNGMDSLGGGVDLQVLAGTLETMYGVDTGLKLEEFTNLRRLGEDLFGYKLEKNHPLTGDDYYTYSNSTETDIDMFIHGTIDPSVFGGKWEYHIGQITRNWAMLDKLVELGIPVEKEDVEAINKICRAEATIRKRCLTDDEVRAIAAKVLNNK